MRTALFLLAGFLLLAAFLVLARLFAQHYPSATTWATIAFVLAWFLVTAANMWVGVNRAGYSAAEEVPILLLLFGAPALAAVVLKWRLL
ncbi:MAG TPA: hypothetical protein VMG60_10355 [Burkholderiaceae bacterium]|nr:hypothetical protein [Burkholderiaceae bacterium]